MFYAPSTPIRPFQIPENIEIVELLIGGKVFFEDNGVEKTYGAGTIFWHGQGEYTIFRTPPDDPYRCLAISLLVTGGKRLTPRVSFWRSAVSFEAFALDACALFESCSRRLSPELLVAYITGTLLRQSLGGGGKEGGFPKALQKACRLLNADPGLGTMLDQVAAECGISRTQLFRLFKRHLNTSPYQYTLSRRLTTAGNLLLTQELPIKEIAGMCGFTALEVFYRQFRRRYGRTPGEYRADKLPFTL